MSSGINLVMRCKDDFLPSQQYVFAHNICFPLHLPLAEPPGVEPLVLPPSLLALLLLAWADSLANMLLVRLWNLEIYSRDNARSVARMHLT